MRTRIILQASTAVALCLVGGCAFIPAPKGPARVGDLRRSAERPGWADFLACAVLSDSTSKHGNVRDVCGDSKIDASRPGEPLPRPTPNTP